MNVEYRAFYNYMSWLRSTTSEGQHVIRLTCHQSRSTKQNIQVRVNSSRFVKEAEKNMVSSKVEEQEVDTNPCAVCSEKATFRCSSCKTVFYCGRAHQLIDWRKHRSVCRIRQTLAEIKQAKCHRADLIISKRNRNRTQRTLAMTKDEEDDESMSGSFRTLNRPDYVATQGLVGEVVKDLAVSGFAVINNFIDTESMNEIRGEIGDICTTSRLYPGKLSMMKSGAMGSIRSDLVQWVDVKHDCPYAAIYMAVKRMDKVANVLNASRILRGCDIRSRSPAMVAYYPARSSGYKQHVDNPNQDGRKLTFILYTNAEYDQRRHGGMLRIHRKDKGLYYDIEPLDGRLVIFWSDNRVPHEVLPTNNDRYAISLWYFDLIERAKTLVKCPAGNSQQILKTCFVP